MAQPKWKLIAQLGDANPIDYGGYFIFEDMTGVYTPEGEYLVSPDDDESGEPYIIYRFTLERCTFVDGVLSDNRFHPEMSAWFSQSPDERVARPQDSNLDSVAITIGSTEASLVKQLCSENPITRAHAYRAIGEYHGFENLDAYPLSLSRAEVEARYADKEVEA